MKKFVSILCTALLVVSLPIMALPTIVFGDEPEPMADSVPTAESTPTTDPADPTSEGGGTADDTADLPNVVGMSLDQARAALNNMGFTLIVSHTATTFNENYDPGDVIAQDPMPSTTQTRFPLDTSVTLTVNPEAPAAEEADVPDVTGMTSANAVAALKNAGFTNVTTVTADTYNSDFSVGAVIDQNIVGGPYPFDTQITLYVNPSPLVSLPNVIGMTEAAAKAALTEANFTNVTVVEADAYDSSKPVGTVLSMTPLPTSASDEMYPVDTAITLTVNPAEPTLPDVVGMTEQEALNTLLALGYSRSEINVYHMTYPNTNYGPGEVTNIHDDYPGYTFCIDVNPGTTQTDSTASSNGVTATVTVAPDVIYGEIVVEPTSAEAGNVPTDDLALASFSIASTDESDTMLSYGVLSLSVGEQYAGSSVYVYVQGMGGYERAGQPAMAAGNGPIGPLQVSAGGYVPNVELVSMPLPSNVTITVQPIAPQAQAQAPTFTATPLAASSLPTATTPTLVSPQTGIADMTTIIAVSVAALVLAGCLSIVLYRSVKGARRR